MIYLILPMIAAIWFITRTPPAPRVIPLQKRKGVTIIQPSAFRK